MNARGQPGNLFTNYVGLHGNILLINARGQHGNILHTKNAREQHGKIFLMNGRGQHGNLFTNLGYMKIFY
jgi:hypothetical protein